MQNLILLYDNAADAAQLATVDPGGWQTLDGGKLSNMQDPRPTKRAISANLSAGNTRFRVTLTAAQAFRAIAFGPTNLRSGDQYRIRSFTDGTFVTADSDTTLLTFGPPAEPSLDLEWEDPNFWNGAASFEDPDNAGLWVIHVYDSITTSRQHWQIDVRSLTNPDGFVSIGRLYMGLAYQPLYNFEPNSNRFGAVANTTFAKAAGGTRYYNRRQRERTWDLVWGQTNPLTRDDAYTDIYRITAICDLDKQVFVIPDPEEGEHMSKISFLGNLSELPSISLIKVANATTGFRITEAL